MNKRTQYLICTAVFLLVTLGVILVVSMEVTHGKDVKGTNEQRAGIDLPPLDATVESSEITVAGPAYEVTPMEAVAPSKPNSNPDIAIAVEPTSYAYAAEMNKAGIAETDYGFATDMVLDENGWRTTAGEKRLWQKANSPVGDSSLTGRLTYANYYVLQNYGSWQAAHDLYVAAGNF